MKERGRLETGGQGYQLALHAIQNDLLTSANSLSSSAAMSVGLRIVLVGTQHPGNIGAAARAMKTMGLRELVLVAPLKSPNEETLAMAVGADDVVAAARICATLDEAIADCVLVAGCTARPRLVQLSELTPREVAPRLLAAASSSSVALLFGPERAGLTNEDLQRCHLSVHIPADPQYSSLNLGAAVQVLSYELRLAQLAQMDADAHPSTAAHTPAAQAAMEGFYAHLDQALHDIDFHKGRSPAIVLRRLRRLFPRAQPDERELRILRGILADAQRMARLAQPAIRSGSE
jgi:tRNA (cytidine32/uridine32-2'-O)-methyltransferase